MKGILFNDKVFLNEDLLINYIKEKYQDIKPAYRVHNMCYVIKDNGKHECKGFVYGGIQTDINRDYIEVIFKTYKDKIDAMLKQYIDELSNTILLVVDITLKYKLKDVTIEDNIIQRHCFIEEIPFTISALNIDKDPKQIELFSDVAEVYNEKVIPLRPEIKMVEIIG